MNAPYFFLFFLSFFFLFFSFFSFFFFPFFFMRRVYKCWLFCSARVRDYGFFFMQFPYFFGIESKHLPVNLIPILGYRLSNQSSLNWTLDQSKLLKCLVIVPRKLYQKWTNKSLLNIKFTCLHCMPQKFISAYLVRAFRPFNSWTILIKILSDFYI